MYSSWTSQSLIKMSTTTSSFEPLKTCANASNWGPTELPAQFLDLPYASFGKSDRLGKASDFTSHAHYRRGGYHRHDHNVTGVNAEFQYKHDTIEDESFQLVDTVKTAPKSKYSTRLRPFSSRVGRLNNRPVQKRGAAAGAVNPHIKQKGQQQLNKRWDRLSNARRMYSTRRREERRPDRASSVPIQTDWRVIEQFDLAQLTKLSTQVPEVEDVKWCGEKATFDETYDRVSTRNDKPLVRYPDKEFYYVTTTEDPVIEELATNGAATVFATDAILAHLMTCPRSNAPWDVVVQKVGNVIFFDKRDDSAFDLLTVDETAFDPPLEEDVTNINHPDNLSIEATMINQNFSQQILKQGSGQKLAHPNPFADESTNTASIAYRYRTFDLGNDVKLVTRCDVHGETNKRGEKELITAYALNEWDSKISKNAEWRMKLDAQRGAILATELKNNSAKLAKWTAQSLLAGVDQMKLGFVSRTARNDNSQHVILGTHSYKPKDFASQIALNANNMWGIMKMLTDLFTEQPEGKYVILRDPNKPVVRIYAVPANTFEESDEEEELGTVQEEEEE